MNFINAKVVAVVLVAAAGGASLSNLGQAIIRPRGVSVLDSYTTETRLAPFAKRSYAALGGRAFVEKTAELSTRRRELAIVAEIVAGNVPDHLRTLIPVRLQTKDRQGRMISATTWVLPDYLAIGSDDDFVRVPLSLEAAGRLAIHLGMALPTTKIVNEIYQSATVKLTPRPMPPTQQMTSIAYAIRHNDLIQDDLAQIYLGQRPGLQLVAGHKKDLVMTPRLTGREDREAIFGWHRPSGKPIQPLSTVHGRRYVDYSHGIRFVNATIFVDGRDVSIEDALDDATTVDILSQEGRFSGYGTLLEAGAFGTSRSKFFKVTASLKGALGELAAN